MKQADEIKYRSFTAGGPASNGGPGSGNYEHHKNAAGFYDDTHQKLHDKLAKNALALKDDPNVQEHLNAVHSVRGHLASGQVATPAHAATLQDAADNIYQAIRSSPYDLESRQAAGDLVHNAMTLDNHVNQLARDADDRANGRSFHDDEHRDTYDRLGEQAAKLKNDQWAKQRDAIQQVRTDLASGQKMSDDTHNNLTKAANALSYSHEANNRSKGVGNTLQYLGDKLDAHNKNMPYVPPRKDNIYKSTSRIRSVFRNTR